MPDAAPAPSPASPGEPPPAPGSGAPAPARKGCLGTLVLVLGVAVVLLGAPSVIGRFLPERYEARTRLRLKSSPEKVFDMLADVRRNPMTGARMQRVERLADGESGLPRWREVLTESEVVVETEALARPSLVKRRVRDATLPISGESVFEIAPAEGGGSIVTASSVTVIGDGAPSIRFMMAIFSGAQTGLEGFWLHVARELNDKVTFEGKAPRAATATAAPLEATPTATPGGATAPRGP